MSSNDKFERDFEAFLAGGDAELSALYRKLPREEPDAKLDAAVLAMAHRALNPELVATPIAPRAQRPRRRAWWVPALSAAATAVFAIGVAVKLAPRMWTQRPEATPAAARDEGVVHVRPVEAPAPAPQPPLSPPPPAATIPAVAAPPEAPRQRAARAAPAPAPAPPESAASTAAAPPAAAASAPPLQKSAPAPVVGADRDSLDGAVSKKTENLAAPAPQAFPGQPARTIEMDAVERKQAIAEGAWQRLHENEPADKRADSAPLPSAESSAPAPAGSTANPAVPEQRAATAAAAVPTEAEGTAGALGAQREDVRKEKGAGPQKPQAWSAQTLRNSRLYPESWVAAIQLLVKQGRRADAHENLALFRQKYPDYRLPPDLQRFAREPQ